MDIIKGLDGIASTIKNRIEVIDELMVSVAATQAAVQRLREDLLRMEFEVRDMRAAILGAVRQRSKNGGVQASPPLTSPPASPHKKPEPKAEPKVEPEEKLPVVKLKPTDEKKPAIWYSKITGRKYNSVERPSADHSDGTDFILPEEMITSLRLAGFSLKQRGFIIDAVGREFSNWKGLREDIPHAYGIHRPTHVKTLAYVAKITKAAVDAGKGYPKIEVKQIADDCGIKLSVAYNACNAWRHVGAIQADKLAYKVIRFRGQKSGPAIVIGHVRLGADFPLDEMK